MQVINQQTSQVDDVITKPKLLALPYYEIKEPQTEEETVVIEQSRTEIQQRQSKKDRKKQVREFLGKRDEVKEFREEEKPVMTHDDSYSAYDGELVRQWMRTDFDRIRNKIYYCETPPISDYPEEEMKIENAVKQYKSVGVFRDADKVKDYIESLMWYGKVNPDLFGTDNYILNETIEGYKEIYEKLMKLKGTGDGDEALRLLGKLITVAIRPLVIGETMMKETEYEPSASEGGVYGGEYNQDEDGI